MSKRKRIMTILKIFSIIMLYLASLINIIFYYMGFRYDFDNSIVYDIHISINGELIYSFIQRNDCFDDEKTLEIGRWDGLKEGCYCSWGVSEGQCLRNTYGIICSTIPSSHPKNYEIFNTKKICIKTLNIKYMDLEIGTNIVENNEECPSNYILCGVIDTLNRKLCLKSGEKCPVTINEIEILNFPQIKDSEQNNKILSLFKVSENTPCINPEGKEWKTHYILEYSMKNCSEINGLKYDFRYEKLSNFETSKYQLYKDNSILSYYPENTYEDFSKEKVYIFARSFLGLNKDEIKEFSYDKLKSAEKVSNKTHSFMIGFAYASIIFLGLFFIVYLINIIYCCYKNNFSSLEELTYYKILCFIIQSMILIVFFILSMIIFGYSLKIKSILKINEIDEITKEIMNILLKNINKNCIFGLLSLIFFVLFVVSLIIIILIKKYLRYY